MPGKGRAGGHAYTLVRLAQRLTGITRALHSEPRPLASSSQRRHVPGRRSSHLTTGAATVRRAGDNRRWFSACIESRIAPGLTVGVARDERCFGQHSHPWVVGARRAWNAPEAFTGVTWRAEALGRTVRRSGSVGAAAATISDAPRRFCQTCLPSARSRLSPLWPAPCPAAPPRPARLPALAPRPPSASPFPRAPWCVNPALSGPPLSRSGSA